MTDEVAERRFEATQRFAHSRGEQHEHDERGDQHDDIGGPTIPCRAGGNGEESSLQQAIGVDRRIPLRAPRIRVFGSLARCGCRWRDGGRDGERPSGQRGGEPMSDQPEDGDADTGDDHQYADQPHVEIDTIGR